MCNLQYTCDTQGPNLPHYYLRTDIQVIKLYKSLRELPIVRLNEPVLKEIDYRSGDTLGDSSIEKAFCTTAHPVIWNRTRKFPSVNRSVGSMWIPEMAPKLTIVVKRSISCHNIQLNKHECAMFVHLRHRISFHVNTPYEMLRMETSAFDTIAGSARNENNKP